LCRKHGRRGVEIVGGVLSGWKSGCALRILGTKEFLPQKAQESSYHKRHKRHKRHKKTFHRGEQRTLHGESRELFTGEQKTLHRRVELFTGESRELTGE
jgi:hypothetical protein